MVLCLQRLCISLGTFAEALVAQNASRLLAGVASLSRCWNENAFSEVSLKRSSGMRMADTALPVRCEASHNGC